ncbi:MAG: hypothetical protein PF442_11155, partial [Desulfobulbaceae bacterium]|nr:hypothetical protein [Desulfobulbaceae bacterium]
MKYLFSILTALFILTTGAAVFAAPTTIAVSVKDSIKIDLPTGKNLLIHFQTAEIVEHKIVNHKLVISGKHLGKTALTITNDDGYHAEYLIDVIIENVRKRKVSELLEQICPEGTVTFVLTPTKGDNIGQLILKGTVPSKGRGERLEKLFTTLDYKVVNLLAIEGTQQVQLFVRVAEVIKGNPMSIGINLGGKKDGWLLASPGTNILSTLATPVIG